MRIRGFFLGALATLLMIAGPALATAQIHGPALIAQGRANVSLGTPAPDFPPQTGTWKGAVTPDWSPGAPRPREDPENQTPPLPGAVARLATIQAMAPLGDHSNRSIREALKEAVEVAVRGAIAMDFSWVEVTQAVVLQDRVTVRILATDTEPEGEVRVPIKGATRLDR